MRPLSAPLAEAATFSVSPGLPTDAAPSLPGLLLYCSSVTRSSAVSNDKPTSGRDVKAPVDRGLDAEPQPVSNRVLALFFAALFAALVLGYLFLNKLVDISRQEDCMLSHAKNCAATELPSPR